jgi:hypothetical protein
MFETWRVTDQPGRILCLCILCPLILVLGVLLILDPAHAATIGYFFVAFAVFLFCYESFWVNSPPKVAIVFPHDEVCQQFLSWAEEKRCET